jgi:hypothetical protein
VCSPQLLLLAKGAAGNDQGLLDDITIPKAPVERTVLGDIGATNAPM